MDKEFYPSNGKGVEDNVRRGKSCTGEIFRD